jgi:hypothetical protein
MLPMADLLKTWFVALLLAVVPFTGSSAELDSRRELVINSRVASSSVKVKSLYSPLTKRATESEVQHHTQSEVGVDASDGIETYRLDNFPKSKTSMHMPCAESEQFATNCACHIKCLDRDCQNAKKLCLKYKDQGCKYMLLRGPQDKLLATLKREPTASEQAAFDVSAYPDTQAALEASELWRQHSARQMKLKETPTGARIELGPTIGDLTRGPLSAGTGAVDTLSALMREGPSSPYCHDARAKNATWKADFLNRGISLVALSYRTPKSLANSVRTWKSTGLLGFVRERHIILNDPLPQDLAIAAEHGFQIHQPKDLTEFVKQSKPNVMTIGSAFYAAMRVSTSDYVLFLENDFKMDVELTASEIQAQLVGAVGMLDRGVEIVRLLSRKAKGCGTHKDCGHAFRPSPNDQGGDRKRNWFSFYCAGFKGTDPYVADCLEGEGALVSANDATAVNMGAASGKYVPRFRCFTSWDSNWSVNAVLVKRHSMLTRTYKGSDGSTIGPIADLGRSFWDSNDGFERAMAFNLQWMKWQPRVPICISYDGMFRHEEIETSA